MFCFHQKIKVAQEFLYQKISFNLIFHLLFSVNIILNVTFPVVPGSESGCYHRNKHLEMFLTVFC